METNEKKTLFSGIQPTGIITIGNYLGALKNWVKLADEYNSIFCIVDMHAITVSQEPSKLRKNTMELLALYIACGLNPENCTLFIQSHVPSHAELAWALNCITYIGEISRMTQFKDKSKKYADNVNMGLMDYPVLMAADILLYQSALVPVGADQKQHLELARDLAQRFNNKYSETFVVPEGYIPSCGAKIYSLSDPTKKMSKSDENINGYIAMTDDAETILRKCKRAVTDSDTEIKFSKDKAGVSNLLTIFSLFSGLTIAETEKHFNSLNYGQLKVQTADAIIQNLSSIQIEQKKLLQDTAYLESILKVGAEKANRIARKTLSKVYRKIGFISSTVGD